MLINLERARAKLRAAGLDAVILTTQRNVQYAAGFVSEFMQGQFEDFTTAVVLPTRAEMPAALILPEFDLPYLVESRTWIEELYSFGNPWSSVGLFMGHTLEANLSTDLRRELKRLRDRLRPRQQDSFFAALGQALRDLRLSDARLGADDMRLARAIEDRSLAAKGVADALQLMRLIRMVKTRPEIELMTRGADINATALEKVIAGAHAGMRERDLTQIYRRHLVESDARHLGDRGMMFGAGDGANFSLPSDDDRTLTPGGAVVLDCLGTYRGYHMDLARTAVVGEPSKEQRHRYQSAVKALEAVEDRIRPGVHAQDLRGLVRDTIAGCGLRRDLVSVTTHGLGLDVFEFPEADSLEKGFVLEAGMVVNTEVFYRDLTLGAFHLEDSVLVTADGCRQLRPLSRDLVCF
ncbi:MAG: aminopeptidase P family protein [Alphaproteobacteria bacterium]|nr:aminopeptidase P family protein [Alphaproteobacteria bacterium]